jgi:hypothetical protein
MNETTSFKALARHWSRYLFLQGAFAGLIAALIIEPLWGFPTEPSAGGRLFVFATLLFFFWHLTIGGGFILDYAPDPGESERSGVVLGAVGICVASVATMLGVAFTQRWWGFAVNCLSPMLLGIGLVWRRKGDILRLVLSLEWLGLMIWALWIVGPIASIFIGFCALIVYHCYNRLSLNAN